MLNAAFISAFASLMLQCHTRAVLLSLALQALRAVCSPLREAVDALPRQVWLAAGRYA